MTEEQSKKIEIYVMGKKYRVPDSLTIMKALEYAGYKYLRGCGCRGGFCGACATVYRLPGDYKLHVALACQEVVQDVAILARRLYSKHIAPPARHLADRMKEIEEGKFDEELEKLTKMKKEELQELYTKRDMEPK
jgi:hypothetical protein